METGSNTQLMGGAVCLRKDRPLRLMMIERPTENRYGEVVTRLHGLWFGPSAVITGVDEWTIRMLRDTYRKY